jgi:hypothetical protein
MKAIFAVTALAAAISGQALAADTETTTSFTGTMDAQFIYNLAEQTETIPTATSGVTEDVVVPSNFDVDLNDDGDDNEGYEVTMSTAITNGPFSASVGVTSREGVAALDIGDIIVTDGNLSFGQVGTLMSTDEYIDASVTMAGGDDMDPDADVGFRYVAAEGLTVQLGGDNTDTAGTSLIASAQFAGAAGSLAYVVEGQMKASAVGSEKNLDAPMFVGAAATYSADIATVMAALNYTSDTAGVTDTDYAVNATTTVAGATLTVGYLEPSTETTDDEEMFGGVSYAIDVITLSAGYKMTTLADAGDEVTAGLGYSAGLMAYSADVTLGEFDAATASDALIELNGTYSAASGVSYSGDYAMQGDTKSVVTLGASYAF